MFLESYNLHGCLFARDDFIFSLPIDTLQAEFKVINIALHLTFRSVAEFEHSTFGLRGERSYALRHRCGYVLYILKILHYIKMQALHIIIRLFVWCLSSH